MAVFTAIGAAAFGAGTLMAGISAAALQIAAGVAINYFVASLNGASEQQFAGMQGQIQVGSDVSRTVPVGLGLADLSPVYGNYWGQEGKTPNAYLTQVFCVGDYPVKGLAEFYLDGTLEQPLWNEANEMGAPLAGKRRDGKDHAWVKFYDGTQIIADPWLVSKFASHPERPYSNRRVGYGCPYIILTTKVSDELWPGGLPQPKVVLSGARLYDISKDSTRGGNGPQRIGQPNTWGGDGDDLTAVQAYALLTGFRVNGQWLYGLQSLPMAQLPDAWWVAQVNACRATVTGPSGQEPTYRSGGSLRVSRPISETMTDLTTSCQGRIVEVGGEYRLHVGALTPPVYHITDGDVLSTEYRRFVPFFGLSDTVNGIAATHPSPVNGWNIDPLPTLFRPDLEAQDGNRQLLASVTLNMVPYAWQAQRIMASALAEARDERKLTLALPGAFYLALPGEFITFTSAANGFVNKLFRIDGAVDRADGNVLWDITEFGTGGYDPDFDAYVPPVAGSLSPGYVPIQTIIGWEVVADVINDDQGRPRRPAVRFGWDKDIEGVRAVGMELRTRLEHELVFSDSFDNVSAGQVKVASARILPAQDLEGRGRYFSSSGSVPQEWTGWYPVTTLPLRFGALDVDLDNLAAEVAKSVADLDAWARFNTRETIEEKRKLNLLNVAGAVGDFTNRQMIQRQASSEAAGNRASFREDILTATGPNSALALLITELRAEVFDPLTGLPATSAIVNLLSAEVRDPGTGLEAVGNSILQLGSTVGKFSADGLLRVQTVANTTGAVATAALGVAASDGANMGNAALYLRAMSDGSSEAFVVANRFAVKSSPTGTSYGVFAVDNGVVWIDEGRVRNLTTVNINVVEVLASNVFTTNFRATWAQLENAVVNNFRANAANIGDLTIGRDKLADGAFADYIGPGATSGSGNSVTYFSSDFVAGAKPVFMCVSAQVNRAGSPDGSVSVFLDGVSAGTSIPIGGSASTQYLSIALMRLLNNGQTYRLRLVVSNSGTQGSISVTEVAFGGMIPRK